MAKIFIRTGKLLGALLLLLIVGGASWQWWSARSDARRFPPPGQRLVVNGHHLHIRCIGKGAPTVLMLSGSGTPSVTSYGVQDRIAGFTRVCSYDRAGLGWSDPSPLPMSLTAMTDDAAALITAAGEKGPFVLMPESFGGLIAIALLERAPQQVAGAVFVDASEPRLWATITGDQIPAIQLRSTLMTVAGHLGLVRALFDWGKPAWVDRLSPTNRAWFRAVWSRPMPGLDEVIGVYQSSLVTALPPVMPGAMYDKPLIVLVHGKRSAMLGAEFEPGWPAAQRRLATLSRGSRLVVARDTGHAIVGENPALVTAAVHEVVERARAAAQPAGTAAAEQPAT